VFERARGVKLFPIKRGEQRALYIPSFLYNLASIDRADIDFPAENRSFIMDPLIRSMYLGCSFARGNVAVRAIYHKSLISLPISRDYQGNLLASLNVTRDIRGCSRQSMSMSMSIRRNSISRLSGSISRKIASHRANVWKIDRECVRNRRFSFRRFFASDYRAHSKDALEERRDRGKIAGCARGGERGACSTGCRVLICIRRARAFASREGFAEMLRQEDDKTER